MTIFQKQLEIMAPGQGFVDVTSRVQAVVSEANVQAGLCTVFVLHTSASLLIQENADPAVRRDLEALMADLAPESRAWEHDDEGPDDMPAHARSALTQTSLCVPISGGRLVLGTWQGLYLWQHRRRREVRQVFVHVDGVHVDGVHVDGQPS
jgi:secondary thiamine-phosphate synthase enzyme